MNEPTPPASSGLAAKAIAVFAVGAVFGAFSVIELVPAASLVEFEEADAIAQAPDPSADSGEAGTPVTAPGDDVVVNPSGRQGEDATTSSDPSDQDPTGENGGGADPGDGGNPGTPGTTPSEPSTPAGSEAGDLCASGRNAGATDRGVTETEIKMATTVVQSGIGAAFLGETRFAMEAVKNRVNQAGGICGRLLDITYRDDAWEADDGAQFLRNFIADGIFAVPVGPSSEGLNTVIESGDFDAAQVPVIGTNGLSLQQYTKTSGEAQPWVFPVAVATVSSARIMAKDAYDRGARDFSIVFASNYKFGSEAAEAFNAEVKRLTGSDIDGYEPNSSTCNQSYCGVTSGQSNYSAAVTAFEPGDFVALFLEPQTALAWMGDENAIAAHDRDTVPFGFGAAQPLFTEDFGTRCKTQCDQMEIWTGFKPFQEGYRSDPAVQEFVTALRNTNPNADVNNQFTMGAYLGMELLVDGLEAVGSDLTRVKLKQELDRMQFDASLSLTDPMQFSADNRYVATRMEAWEVQYKGSFAGWKNKRIVTDPRFGG